MIIEGIVRVGMILRLKKEDISSFSKKGPISPSEMISAVAKEI